MSLQVEQAVLGGLMLDNAEWDNVKDILTPESFETLDNRIIFETIARLLSNNEPADIVTIINLIKSSQDKQYNSIKQISSAYIILLVEDTPTSANTLAYAKILQTKTARRTLKKELLAQLADIDNVELDTTPQSTHNAVLDTSTQYCSVNFLHAVCDSHILKQLAISISNATFLPVHTVFLVGLAIFSSMACRRWNVLYKYGGKLPIGMYLVAEQPSGTAKTWTVSTFQKPFVDAFERVKTNSKTKLNELLNDKDSNDQAELDRLNSIIRSVLFVTSGTPEGIEKSLSVSGGYFSAISSEQGLFNTVLGGCYSDKASNNDLLLSGFSGDYMGSMRVSREGYSGSVIGGVTMFAQSGGIETLLQASNGTGLAERFLLIAEQHNLGNRNFNHTSIISYELTQQYASMCSFTDNTLTDGSKFVDLPSLEIGFDGWGLISEYRMSIEKNLADGGKYSHIAIRGAAAKIDMQIMKVAANLHLLDNERNWHVIDIKHVKSAIIIADAMLENSLSLCKDKELIGSKAEYNAILSLFENGTKPRTEREIIQVKSKTRPYKEFTGNKSELIRLTLADMVKNGVLQEVFLPNTKFSGKPIKAYTLAQ